MFFQKNRSRYLVVLVLLLFLWTTVITGCSTASKDAALHYEETLPDETVEDVRMGIEPSLSTAGPERSEQNNLSKIKPRFVIRTGSLTLTVFSTRETVEQIEQMTVSGGGIISESNVYELRGGQYAAELTLRVPETKFDSFITRLQDLGKTDNIQKNSEDVTLPYLDMEARIKNLRAEEKRLREILSTAKTVEDILQVERELSRVRGEIEAMTTEFTYLQDQVAFSTIQISVKEEAIDTQTISQKPFENMGNRMKEALFRSINYISSAIAFVLIALSTILPVLMIIALPALLIFWLLRANRRKKESAPPGGQPPAMD